MAISFADLLSAKTAQTIYGEMIAGVQAAGVRVANWRTGGPYRTFLRVGSVVAEQWYNVAQAFVASGFLDYATGDWLTLLAASLFFEDRAPALFAAGTVTLTNAAGAGPYTVAAGGLIVATASGLRYRSTASVTVPASGTATVAVRAESPGARYNVGANAIDRLVTPTLLGLSAGNPAADWITSAGADEETDERLRTRCKAKWGTLGTGSPDSAYLAWALAASAEVAKVGVNSNNYLGVFVAQYVTLILAGDGATVSDQAVADVLAYVNARRPNCMRCAVAKATTVTQSITAAVYVRSAQNTAATQGAIVAALDALAAATPIGGTVYLSRIIATIQDAVPGGAVRNVVVTLPAADVGLTYSQVINFTYSLSYVGV